MPNSSPSANPVPAGWAAIARLVKARGLKGELSAESWSSKPERFDSLDSVTLWPLGRAMTVENVWWHGDRPVFAFEGVDSMTDAEPLVGQLVCVPVAERVALEPGEVFYGDLIGCNVFQGERKLGVVGDYQETGGPLLLEMGPHLIPFVPAICVKVDTAAKRIDVELPDGFLEINA